MNAFFDSQFRYCPLIWMSYSRTNEREIDRHHKIYLRIIYNHKKSSFKELLEKDSSVSIHERNVQILATEIHNINNNLSPPFTNKTFEVRNKNSYNLRQNSQFFWSLVKSVYILRNENSLLFRAKSISPNYLQKYKWPTQF